MNRFQIVPGKERDFDKRLQTEVSMDLYSFIATVKLDEGDSFQVRFFV